MKRLALLVAVLMLSAGVASGQDLIENLQQFHDNDPWTIETNIQEGDEMFVDRDYTITDLPEELAGLEWIRTANDSADWRGDDPDAIDVIATFDVTADVTVYMAFDQRDIAAPCFEDWTDTGLFIDDDESGSELFKVLSQFYSADSTVSLCERANEADSNMYIVMVAGGGAAECTVVSVGDDGYGSVGETLTVTLDCADVDDETVVQLLADDTAMGTGTVGDGVETDDPLEPGDDEMEWTLLIDPDGLAIELAVEWEFPPPPPVPEGTPVAGMLGLGLVAAACALGGAMTLRKK